MSEGIIIALITTIGSIVGAIIGNSISAKAVITAASIKDGNGQIDQTAFPKSQWILGGAIIGGIIVIGGLWFLGFFPSITPPSVTGNFIINENFEDGIAQDFFAVSGNWKVISESDNKVWDIDNSAGSDYAGVNFSEEITGQNYTIQYRVKMMNFVSQATPETILYFRVDDKGNKNVQAFTPDYNGSKLITFGKATNDLGWEAISTQVYPFATEKWYTIQIIAQDNDFKIYVGNKLVINSNDSQVTSGSITLQVGPGAHVRFDDIFVSNN
jgi:hypothetical protein